MQFFSSLCVLVFLVGGCGSSKKIEQQKNVSYIGQQAVIYKTKADYSNYVAVTLNSEKTAIIAYPAPSDIAKQGEGAKPVKLKNDFWLDNRGIGVNTVFINITLSEFAKLDAAPSLDVMMNAILDKDPFTEIYNLGERKRFANEVNEINGIIQKKLLGDFKRLK